MPVSEDDLDETMFDGKITVREFEALSPEDQEAMLEAEGWGFG